MLNAKFQILVACREGVRINCGRAHKGVLTVLIIDVLKYKHHRNKAAQCQDSIKLTVST